MITKASIVDHWIFDRVARYARWYIRFRGRLSEPQRKAMAAILERRTRS